MDDSLRFDPDVSPQNLHNREAAKRLGLSYDERVEVYRDEDGCIVLDKFGQPLG